MSFPSLSKAQINSELILPVMVDDAVKIRLAGFDNAHELCHELLSVFVGDPRDNDRSRAVHGKYEFEGNYLEFIPSFPFEKGLQYFVRYRPSINELIFSYQAFRIGDKQITDEAKVTAIHPLADELPENLLRFYIYFNTPMKRGQSIDYIQLRDAEGNVDSAAFMKFKYELWSADGKRLTVLFDPGRLKRGVSTNMRLGPALLEGKNYELSVLGCWQDVYGNELKKDFIKQFKAVSAYRQHININEWSIQEPKSNTVDTLSINCNRVMDHALVQSMIQVLEDLDNPIAGQWHISENGRVLRFIPNIEWRKVRYRLLFDNALEDVAGNNLNSLLDQSESTNNATESTSHVICLDL